jgi:hypothetical protein
LPLHYNIRYSLTHFLQAAQKYFTGQASSQAQPRTSDYTGEFAPDLTQLCLQLFLRFV